jgi:adenine-specific DNA-methyltransferase
VTRSTLLRSKNTLEPPRPSAGRIRLLLTVAIIKHMPKRFAIHKKYRADSQCVLHHGNCIDLLSVMEDSAVDLTVTSPPYCIGKEYESSRTVEDFIATHERVFPEVVRVTKPGGSICWQVGFHVRDRYVVPLDYVVYAIAQRYPELRLRNRLIWTFGHGLHEGERFTGRHETILWFTKGDEYTFNLDAVRVPQKYPGKKYYRGPNKGQYSGNPLGKNPSDVWEVPNVNANHLEKTDHPCQFPVAIPERLIKALTGNSAVVFDPFAGAGSTGAAALILGRRFVGAELNSDYWHIAAGRLREAASGKLRFRDDEPVLDPNGTGAVAVKPQHFMWAN